MNVFIIVLIFKFNIIFIYLNYFFYYSYLSKIYTGYSIKVTDECKKIFNGSYFNLSMDYFKYFLLVSDGYI